MAQNIDGRSLAAARKANLLTKCHHLTQKLGRAPALAVILVGDDPASHIYVRNKIKMCAQLQIESITRFLPEETSQLDLLSLIHQLNEDKNVDGILLQLPLPKHLNGTKAIRAISPAKDVDGLHPLNQGLLMQGTPFMVPCTPQGCLQLIQSCCDDIRGTHVVVVGRSVLVGRPMALLLLNHDATVTLTHSKTPNLKDICKQADILIAATGQARMITADYIKPGAIIIDVGQSRVGDVIAGDVDYDAVAPLASYITPVPGGVGPMTIINLMENLLHAADASSNKD